ncbi:glycosyltransferase family 87 protein [Actinomarinicola tropica]|uniref:DUF2029 domain-containing protein n=1 Tax=Actinomarinicola tropica TaxID=2789776 RepID=A0A5Q2RI74_9ACTN|nr:glycosyltransferase family 87 protein [Actinomarinicola tropica]QGG95503.1 DUF2029 domain-containing protein [Actinomarinicola tropica]
MDRTRVYPLAVLGALLLAVLLVVVSSRDAATLTGRLGGDLPEFVGAGRIVADGDGVDLYEPERQLAAQADLWADGETGGILFPYPAVLAAPYAAMADLDLRLVYLVHTGFMVGCALASVRLLRGRLPWLERRYAPAALAVGLTFLPMFIGVFNGQTTAAVLLLVVAVWVALLDDRDLLAGVAAGLLLVKPQYGAVVVGLLLLDRRWRALGGAAAASLAVWLGSALVAGPGWVARWLEMVSSLSDIDQGSNLRNEVSPLGMAEVALGQGSGAAAVIGMGASAAVAVLLVLSLRGLPLASPLVPALVLPSLLLIAPHALYYDAGLLLVALAALLPTVPAAWRLAAVAAWWAAGFAHLGASTLGFEPVTALVVGTFAWAHWARWTGASADLVGARGPSLTA